MEIASRDQESEKNDVTEDSTPPWQIGCILGGVSRRNKREKRTFRIESSRVAPSNEVYGGWLVVQDIMETSSRAWPWAV